MVASVRNMWVSCAVALCVVAIAKAASNEYLPPNKGGYSYDPPAIPFPPQNNANKIPTPPAYRPLRPTQPAPRPNTYIPPSPGPSPVPHEHHEHHEHHDHGDHHHHEPGMPFDFSYAVNEDDNNFSHNAISDGDVTRGEYRVALPDGRTQIVKYTADWRNGFNAEVSYEGEARYPEAPAGGYGRGPVRQGGQEYLPPTQGGGYQY